ncbi:glutamate-rich protein 3 isoform X2 [Struthio camelus]|uniref:glutamate-rich protein 3 isoform X2 n=1 Tax=Struthio camelus TaxID=8801 RepID=UPI003603C7C8
MSGPRPGFLATYNSLTDKHLAGYFSNRRIRRHLQRSGLISKSGRIISEKEYQLNAVRRDHQKYVQECLAQAIFHKVLDMERHHQLEIKRKLENFVRKERVQKIKVEQSRRSVEDANPVLSPHPPLGPRNHYGLLPLVAGERASRSQLRAHGPLVDLNTGHPSHQHQPKESAFFEMASASRPNTAPGYMQGPSRLQPLRSCAAAGSVPKTSNSKQRSPILENDQQFAGGGEKSRLRLMSSMEYVTGISPYRLPIINDYVIPVPPPPLQKGDKSVKAVRNGMPRRRRFHPTTAPNGLEQLLTKSSGKFHKPSLRSNAFVTMIFLGKSVHLSHDDTDYRDEIKVYQQHCGGENLCVYKGKLLEGETFQFISKRHRGFPFSLTFFLNGMQVDRLSSCCEYKHQKRSRLGGRRGYFGFLNVERASPCYRCIIAMGLDKKPSPPKRKVEEDHEKQAGSLRDGVHRELSESNAEQKIGKDSVLVILSGYGASVAPMEDKMETEEDYRREEMKELSDRETQDSQKDTDYDEDFEADEEVNEEGQTGDQTNRTSKSSSDDEKDNLDHEKESRNSSQKALQASDSEKEENDGYSDSDSEDDNQGEICKGKTAVCEKVAAARKIQAFYRKYKIQQKFKPERRSARSLSSMSTLYSSEDDSAGKTKDDVKGNEEYDIERASDNTAHTRYGNENGENKLLTMEDDLETFALEKKGTDEAEKTETEDVAARENTEIFHENIMAIQHQGPEVNGELKPAGSVESNTKEYGEEDVLVSLESSVMEAEDRREESPPSDEGGDCKSIQEKIAEAIENDHLLNSELEPSDSRTDEKEENLISTEHDINEAPDGAFLAEGTRALEIQKAAEQVVQEGQMVGEKQALEKEDFVAEEGDEKAGHETALKGDLLSKEGTVAVEGQHAVEEPAPEEKTMTEEDPEEKGTRKGMVSGGEVTFGEQEVLKDVKKGEEALEEQALDGEEVVGAVVLIGKEVDGAVSGGEQVAEETSEGEETVEEASEAKEVVSETVSEAEEAMEEGSFAVKDIVEVAVSEGEEAMEDANLAEDIVRVVGPEGEEAMEEAVSEGDEAMEKPEALLETLGEMKVCTGEAAPGREEFIKPKEFPQLKAAGEEWMEMGKAATGATMFETDEPSEVEDSSLQRAEDAVEESMESGKCSFLEVAPGLEALVDAGRVPVTEGSSQLGETVTAEEEEDLAGADQVALLRGNPSLGCKAQTDGAVEGKTDRVVMGESVEKATAESGCGEEVADGAAGLRELAAGMEELLEAAKGKRTEKVILDLEVPLGKEVTGTSAMPVEELCASAAGEVGEEAEMEGAMVGEQAAAGQAVLAEEAAVGGAAVGMALDAAAAGDGGRVEGGMGDSAAVPERVEGAAEGMERAEVGGQAAVEEAAAEGLGVVGETGRDRAGVAGGAAAAAPRGAVKEPAAVAEEEPASVVEAEGLVARGVAAEGDAVAGGAMTVPAGGDGLSVMVVAEAAAMGSTGRPEGAALEVAKESAAERERPQDVSAPREIKLEDGAGSGDVGNSRATLWSEEPAETSSPLECIKAEAASCGWKKASPWEGQEVGKAGLEEQERAEDIVSAKCVEARGTLSVRDKLITEASPNVPGHRDGVAVPAGRGVTGEAGLCQGAVEEEAALKTVITERNPDGREGPMEGETKQVGVKIEWKQPDISENTKKREVEGVTENVQSVSGVRELLETQQRKGSPVPGHANTAGATVTEKSDRDPWKNVLKLDTIVPSTQSQDAEETLR